MHAFFFNTCRGVFLLSLHLVAYADERERAVNQYLKQKITSESGGAVALSSFTKTDGYDQNLEGMKFYILEWQARLNVQVDLWKNGGSFEGYWSSFSVMQKPPSEQDMVWARLGPTMPKEFVKGATVVLTGESKLQKTENGWRVVGLHVKTEKTLNNKRSPAALAELQRQREQELAILAQREAEAAEQRRLAAIVENWTQEKEDAWARRQALLVEAARSTPDTLGQFEFITRVDGEKFGTSEYRTYRLVITSASLTKEIIKVTAKGGPAWSKPDGQIDVIWFDELTAKPSYSHGSQSSLDRVITVKSKWLGTFDLYASRDQKTRIPANDLAGC